MVRSWPLCRNWSCEFFQRASYPCGLSIPNSLANLFLELPVTSLRAILQASPFSRLFSKRKGRPKATFQRSAVSGLMWCSMLDIKQIPQIVQAFNSRHAAASICLMPETPCGA